MLNPQVLPSVPDYYVGDVLWEVIDGRLSGSCGPICNIVPSRLGILPPSNLPFAVTRHDRPGDRTLEKCAFLMGNCDAAYEAYPFTSESYLLELPPQAEITWEQGKKGNGSLVGLLKVEGCAGLITVVPWYGYHPVEQMTELVFLRWFMSHDMSLMARAYSPEVWT